MLRRCGSILMKRVTRSREITKRKTISKLLAYVRRILTHLLFVKILSVTLYPGLHRELSCEATFITLLWRELVLHLYNKHMNYYCCTVVCFWKKLGIRPRKISDCPGLMMKVCWKLSVCDTIFNIFKVVCIILFG